MVDCLGSTHHGLLLSSHLSLHSQNDTGSSSQKLTFYLYSDLYHFLSPEQPSTYSMAPFPSLSQLSIIFWSPWCHAFSGGSHPFIWYGLYMMGLLIPISPPNLPIFIITPRVPSRACKTFRHVTIQKYEKNLSFFYFSVMPFNYSYKSLCHQMAKT